MNDVLAELQDRSRTYRVVLILALAAAGLRLALHGIYVGVMLYPDRSPIEAVPLWIETQDESRLPMDVQIYVDAARRFQNRQELYANADVIEVYQYPPAYAVAFIPFLFLSPLGIAVVHTGLHILAYLGLFLSWHRIFDSLGLAQAKDKLITLLPLWLVFAGFWSDLAYLNIYLIVALISTFLIEAVIHERLGAAVLWLSVLLHIKPHWAFAAVVPLLLGRYRFFLKLVGFFSSLTFSWWWD
ncbi:MAG: hypothetical protein U5L04_07210 [Trueperaceae bacterium]|nr:hypothetical protein [Trueperaceae bacterium]